MKTRKLGPFESSAVAVGCMNFSHAYGTPPDEQTSTDLLLRALDLGYTHFDTAAIYGAGRNEVLLGKALSHRRDEFILASKCGMDVNAEGKREIKNRPENMRRSLENALSRLKTEVIDLYYLHRWEKTVPIEEVVGVLADMVKEGKVKTIGLSEVSADTLRKAHAEHPITAVQSEYSLWTRNPELGVLDACQELGVAFVAFSPTGRKFLTGTLRDVTTLLDGDLRRTMPRFSPENYAKNLTLLDGFAEMAAEVGCSMAELSIAWVLNRAPHIIALPGTINADYLAENAAAAAVDLSDDVMARLDGLINQNTVIGTRYSATIQPEVDTEEFA